MYKLGKKSKANLVGVYPPLAAVVMEAIKISKSDFTVFEGVRSSKRQLALYRRGRSQTLKSYHLNGLAVDLVPWIRGKAAWDGEEARRAFKDIKEAMEISAKKLGYDFIERPISWDLPHWQCTGMREEYDIRKLMASIPF